MPELPIEEGQLIAGKYRVERVLGSGAMGVVVAAWHIELAQRVAVKFVRPDAMTLRDAEERFRREARAAARIRSEHVVRVVDVGTLDAGIPYMVMEFLDGHDLAQELLKRGPLPAYDAVNYVQQVIEALAEAHHANIVHRDLKPANLFLARRPDGGTVVKVLDFGVSKSDRAPGDMSLTQTSAIIGSPLYMAPEQLRSARDVDHRSDIWSLGVILFELLVGRAPYLGDSIAGLVTAMMDAPPSPRAFRPELSEALERVVLRCLERDPKNRFADVAALAAALVEFAPESRLHADRARRVLGISSNVATIVDASARTLNSADPSLRSESLPQRSQTMGGWGQTSTRHPARRTAVVVAAALLGVAAAGVAVFRNLAASDAALPMASQNVAAALLPDPVAAAPVPARPPTPQANASAEVPPAASVAPGTEPTVAAVGEIKPAEPAVTPATSGKPSAASANRPPLAVRPPQAGFAATPKPAPKPDANGSHLPDFGGRR